MKLITYYHNQNAQNEYFIKSNIDLSLSYTINQSKDMS